MRRRRGIIAAAILAAAVEIAARQDAPAQSAPGAPLVKAYVTATVAASGATVSNLTAEDFEVWSDGAPSPIRTFSSEPQDLSVLLLIDGSVSAIDSPMSLAPAIDDGLVSNLGALDQVGFGIFGRQLRFGREFGRDAETLAAIERDLLPMDYRDRIGPSPIWDAVDAATDLLAARPGQRAVILVTDGRATGNRKSLSVVIDHAMQADVAVTVVAGRSYFMPPDASGNAPATNLRTLAKSTGGLFLSGGTPPTVFAGILNQLHHTYAIGFTPPADGIMHRLQVQVKKAGVQVHVRSQYWSGRPR